MKLRIQVLLWGVVGLLGAAVAAAAAPHPSVETILDRYVAALGGKSAFDKVTSRTMKAEVQALGMSGEWDFSAKAPNKQVSQVGALGAVLLEDGFDGTLGWSKDSRNGIRVKKGEELARVKRDSEFNREVRMKSVYPNLLWKAAQTLDGQPVQVLESSPSPRSKERFYFQTQSGLLVCQQTEFEAEGQKVFVEVRLSDYRLYDGIKYPYGRTVRILLDGKEVLSVALHLQEVHHNVPLPDARFSKPTA